MKLSNYLLGFLAGSLLLQSCNHFDDINTNPDSLTQVTPALLATGAIMSAVTPGAKKNFVTHQLVTKHLAWSEMLEETTQYNNFGRDGFDGYVGLRNCRLMAELAETGILPAEQKMAYKGLALLLKAYRLLNYTLSVGDIPYEGILEGEEEHFCVAYNTQKDVFRFLIADLDEAHACFEAARNAQGSYATFGGDPLFGGDAGKWQRVANVLELRVLSMLSKKENEPGLDVKGKFAEVVGRGRLFESNADNLQLTFSSKEGQLYPFHESLQSYKQYALISTTVIEPLKEYHDYRLFYYAKPSAERLADGIGADSWDAYVGTDPSDRFEDIAARTDFCNLNDRYTSLMQGEPFVCLGYAEQNFLLAEAALRGWIGGDASTFYRRGIEASLRFVAEHTPDEAAYHHNRRITDATIETILSQPAIQLSGDFEADLARIMQQKYLAAFMQTPYLAYYDYRRTGYPALPVRAETNRNSYAPGQMPMRWMYPTREYDYNKENVDAAVQRQYGGSDDINQLMWILK